MKHLVLFLALMGCTEPLTDARIYLMGDSMFAVNSARGEAVADVIEDELGEPVIDRAVIGARYFFPLPLSGAAGMKLAAQYREGPWDYVVMNGGGNDLLFGCGCARCDTMLDRLVSADGKTGAIPALVGKIRAGGAKVIYAGYLRNPGTATPIRGCGPAGNELDRRLGRMAKRMAGVTFLPMADVVPSGDSSYHALDRIHPSAKGSRAIGARIAAAIR